MTNDEPIEAVVARVKEQGSDSFGLHPHEWHADAQRLAQEVERLREMELRLLTNWAIEIQAECSPLLTRIERLRAVARSAMQLVADYREWAEDKNTTFVSLPDYLSDGNAATTTALDALQPGDLGEER